MKFVLSFSGGKDSILALHKMVEAGHEPVGLFIMFQKSEGRSWVHGIDRPMLEALAEALALPLICCETDGEDYAEAMEQSLRKMKEQGAEACAFGDIDIEEHRAWDEARCEAVGLQAFLPLWGRDRAGNVREAVRLGYRCVIKSVRHGMLPETLLGQALDDEVLAEMERCGIDLCGENGEYHTIVVDGPLFRHPVELENHGTVRLQYAAVADLTLSGERSSGR